MVRTLPGSMAESTKDILPISSPPNAISSAVEVLDLSILENLLTMLGGEFSNLVQIIDSFLEDAPNLLAELDQSISRGDAGGVRRVAHGLKSNGADFGASRFSALCKELEAIGKSGRAGKR